MELEGVEPGGADALQALADGNYHFTTAKAHITRLGGRVEELVKAEGLAPRSDLPFKGDIDLEALEACIRKETPANVPFFRLEAGTLMRKKVSLPA